MTTDTTIETRIPKAERWAKHVTAVDERAKNGFDWEGQFYHGSQLVDLPPGALVATCEVGGSKRFPIDEVTLYALAPDSSWIVLGSESGKEWASALRKKAREWLARSPEEQTRLAAAEAITGWEPRLEARRQRLALAEKMLEAWRVESPIAGKPQALVSAPAPRSKSYTTLISESVINHAVTYAKLLERAEANIEEIKAAVAEAIKNMESLRTFVYPVPPAAEPGQPNYETALDIIQEQGATIARLETEKAELVVALEDLLGLIKHASVAMNVSLDLKMHYTALSNAKGVTA